MINNYCTGDNMIVRIFRLNDSIDMENTLQWFLTLARHNQPEKKSVGSGVHEE